MSKPRSTVDNLAPTICVFTKSADLGVCGNIYDFSQKLTFSIKAMAVEIL